MMDCQLFGVLVILLGFGRAAHPRCPPNVNEGYIYDRGEKCYQFILTELTWLQAHSYCSDRGGALINVDSYDMWSWTVNVLVSWLGSAFNKQGFWIGLHDRYSEGSFQWDAIGGAPERRLYWSNWDDGEPNDLTGQDCVYMRRSDGWKWIDVGCDGGVGRYYSYACEYNMLPTTTVSTTTIFTTRSSTTTTPATTTSTTTPPITTPPTSTTVPTAPAGMLPITSILRFSVSPKATDDRPINPSTPSANSSLATDDTRDNHDLHDLRDSSRADALMDRDSAENVKGSSLGVSIGIGIFVCVLFGAVVLLLLVWRRHRKRRNMAEANHSMSNPCYLDLPPNNADGCMQSDERYSNTVFTAKPMTATNNVYIEVNTAQDEEPAVNVCSPLTSRFAMDKVDASNLEYLDEGSPYDADGYMKPQHLYVDIVDGEIQDSNCVNSGHYDIPGAKEGNIYEEFGLARNRSFRQ